MNAFVLSQYWYNTDAITSLANSSDPAIIMTCTLAPANSLDKPTTEYNAADADTDRADKAIT